MLALHSAGLHSQRTMIVHLILSALIALFTAVFLNAVFVVVYNRYLAMMHESMIKKIVALAGLPMGSVVGIFAGIGIHQNWFSLSIDIIIGAFSLFGLGIFCWILWQNNRLRKTRWAKARTETLSLRDQGGKTAVNYPAFPFIYQLILRLLEPLNQVDRLQLYHATLGPQELPGLGKGWENRKILHLTDWHLHSTLHPRWTEFLFSVIKREAPDLILFGGDFLSKYPHVNHVSNYLSMLQAPLGVYYVRGNHDFWKSPCRLRRFAEQAGWHLLSNRGVTLISNGDPLRLLGFETPYIPLTTAEELQLSDNDAPCLALVHTPEAYAAAERCGAQVALAGHTHGGQMRLPLLGTTICGCSVPRGLVDGQGRIRSMLTWTSRGAGAFFPLRLNCAPELIVFTIQSKQ